MPSSLAEIRASLSQATARLSRSQGKLHCSRFRSRKYATFGPQPNGPPVEKVAILGGGITGLTTAYYLSRSRPNLEITLFDHNLRLGGWIQSTTVDTGSGSVVFEGGPRNLRPSVPNGIVTLDLIDDLGLVNDLIITPKNSPAAQNRYIYYPDHLVRLPAAEDLQSPWKMSKLIAEESLFAGILWPLITEPYRWRRPGTLSDESVGDFISRRFGSVVADNLVSAVFHGIYAGDIYKMSANSLLPTLLALEKRTGSVLLGILSCILESSWPTSVHDVELRAKQLSQTRHWSGKLEEARNSSVFTLKGGIGTLVQRLVEHLGSAPNVQICKDTSLWEMSTSGEGPNTKMVLKWRRPDVEDECMDVEEWDMLPESAGMSEQFTHVISTIPVKDLIYLSRGTSDTSMDRIILDPLMEPNAPTVMVVNLFYANPSLLPVRGFGYLLPRSIPIEQNPHRALGVVFDSDACEGQDSARGTKLTVMLGGHWWDPWSVLSIPSQEEGIQMAKATLKLHLGIDDEPVIARARCQTECIPQYTLDHDEHMMALAKELLKYNGRLRVAGSSYTGVGLNDCVRAAKDVVDGLINQTSVTGLDQFGIGQAREVVWPSRRDSRKQR